MTVRKQYPTRGYETFADREDSLAQSPTSYQEGGDADKSRSAAAEARRLASEGSWADNFGTPATERTPGASTVDGNEERDVPYPVISQDDPSDPPPVYTPSVSTQVASQSPAAPASPVTARSVPAHIPEPKLFKATMTSTTIIIAISTMKKQTQTPYQFLCDNKDDIRGRGAGGLEKPDPAVALDIASEDITNTTDIVADDRYQLPNFGTKPKPKPWLPVQREHREQETSHSVSGTYQLYDLLDLSTTSGAISVAIEVQPGEKPAVLRLASISGSINVRMTSGGGIFKKSVVSETAKSRVLQTELSTKSGSVHGNVVHGNGGSTSISTESGSIYADVYAVGVSDMDPVSNLSTVSVSGSQHISVVSDVSNTEPIRAIEASHSVRGSGSMTIKYPNEWEGMVHLSAYGSGSLGASGRGLVVRKESRHELYGYKGSKEGRKVEISEQGSGSARFSC